MGRKHSAVARTNGRPSLAGSAVVALLGAGCVASTGSVSTAPIPLVAQSSRLVATKCDQAKWQGISVGRLDVYLHTFNGSGVIQYSRVAVGDARRVIRADSTGHVAADSVAPGIIWIRSTALGYEARNDHVAIHAGKRTCVDIYLVEERTIRDEIGPA